MGATTQAKSSNKVSASLLQKCIAGFLTLALLGASVCFPAQADAEVLLSDVILGETVESRNLDAGKCPNIGCTSAILMDEAGNILFERDAYAPVKIASITKIMTALVAVDYADLSTPILVSETAATVGETSAKLEAGDELTLETALEAMLIPSGNDAAVAIGENIGAIIIASGKSSLSNPLDAFVEAMNNKASQLGLMDTVFRNCHGLDADEFAGDQHSTAYDVALMSKAAVSNPFIASVVSNGDLTITIKRDGESCDINLETTDVLLDMYTPAIGVKTGYTEEAGYCFAGAASSNGVNLYAAVLNSPDTSQRFFDAQALFTWGYSHRVEYKLAQSAQNMVVNLYGTQMSVPIVAEVAHAGWVDRSFYATIADPNQTVIVYDIDGNVSQEVEFDKVESDISVGDKVGTISFYQRNQLIAQVDMVSCEDVEAPNLFQAIGVWFDRLIRNITGKDTVAENIVLNQTPLLNNKNAA